MSRRDVEELPPGRRDSDSARAMITGPLTATIYLVGLVLALVVVAVVVVLADGAEPGAVRSAVVHLLDVGLEPAGWIVALVSTIGSATMVRLRALLGGLRRHAGETRGELADVRAQLAADRDARQARETAILRQIHALAVEVNALGGQFDTALDDLVEGFRVAMATASTPAARQHDDPEGDVEGDRPRGRRREDTAALPAAVEPEAGGPLIAETLARARSHLDGDQPPRWDALIRDPLRATPAPGSQAAS